MRRIIIVFGLPMVAPRLYSSTSRQSHSVHHQTHMLSEIRYVHVKEPLTWCLASLRTVWDRIDVILSSTWVLGSNIPDAYKMVCQHPYRVWVS